MDTWRRKCRNNFTCQLKKMEFIPAIECPHMASSCHSGFTTLDTFKLSRQQKNSRVCSDLENIPMDSFWRKKQRGGKTLLSEKGVSDQQEHLDKNEGSQIETIAVCTLTGENNCESQRQNDYKMKPTN